MHLAISSAIHSLWSFPVIRKISQFAKSMIVFDALFIHFYGCVLSIFHFGEMERFELAISHENYKKRPSFF